MSLNTIADLSTTPSNNIDFLGEDATGSANANAIDTSRQKLAAIMARAYGDLGGLGTVGGTANAIILTSLSQYQALENGLLVCYKAGSAISGASTCNLDSLGAKAIRRQGDSATQTGDIVANGRYLLCYDETYNAAAGAFVLLNPSVSSSTGFTDSSFRIQDDGDATKQIAFQASGITSGQTRTLTPPNANATIAALDVEEQVLTGGARVTSKSLGTVSSGTVTLDPGDRPLQHYTNNGAHTLAPGSNGGAILLEILNSGSAGTITTSGFTKVTGSFTTTSGHKFHCSVVVGNAYSSLTIVALQ